LLKFEISCKVFFWWHLECLQVQMKIASAPYWELHSPAFIGCTRGVTHGTPMWVSLCHFVRTYETAKINYHEILTGYWMAFLTRRNSLWPTPREGSLKWVCWRYM